jgi:hypothetical protein
MIGHSYTAGQIVRVRIDDKVEECEVMAFSDSHNPEVLVQREGNGESFYVNKSKVQP